MSWLKIGYGNTDKYIDGKKYYLVFVAQVKWFFPFLMKQFSFFN